MRALSVTSSAGQSLSAGAAWGPWVAQTAQWSAQKIWTIFWLSGRVAGEPDPRCHIGGKPRSAGKQCQQLPLVGYTSPFKTLILESVVLCFPLALSRRFLLQP